MCICCWKNDASQKMKNKAHRMRIRDILCSLKDTPCKDCGITYPCYIMEFDHVKWNKEFNLASSYSLNKTIDDILLEASKCEIVCANCHAERTHQRRLSKYNHI